MRACNGCRFCCWSWNVPDLRKSELSHCRHECVKGCAVHQQKEQPNACNEFRCPYLDGACIHRPDTFQEVLESLGGNIGNYIPSIPDSMDVEKAKRLIQETRTLPASVIDGHRWVNVILPLDRDRNGGWLTADPSPWQREN